MGKRLGRQCRRNLYTSDPRYRPYPNLKFRDAQTESDYQRETYRFSKSSIKELSVVISILCVLLWVAGSLSFLSSLSCLLGLVGTYQVLPRGPLMVRLVWILPELMLGQALVGPKIADSFTALFPSFCIRKCPSRLIHTQTLVFLPTHSSH